VRGTSATYSWVTTYCIAVENIHHLSFATQGVTMIHIWHLWHLAMGEQVPQLFLIDCPLPTIPFIHWGPPKQ